MSGLDLRNTRIKYFYTSGGSLDLMASKYARSRGPSRADLCPPQDCHSREAARSADARVLARQPGKREHGRIVAEVDAAAVPQSKTPVMINSQAFEAAAAERVLARPAIAVGKRFYLLHSGAHATCPTVVMW